jgi:hypothetical protein
MFISALFIILTVAICGTVQYLVVIHVFEYGDNDQANPASANYDSWYRIEFKVAGGAVGLSARVECSGLSGPIA